MIREESARTARFEIAVGRVLRAGVWASSICLGVGLALKLAGVDAAVAPGLLATGLIILLATPAARVIMSVIDYVRARDWLFVTLTVVVLLELAASVVAALSGRSGH